MCKSSDYSKQPEMLQRDEGFSLVNPPEGCSFHLNFGQLWLWKFLSLSTGNGRSLDNQIDRWYVRRDGPHHSLIAGAVFHPLLHALSMSYL